MDKTLGMLPMNSTFYLNTHFLHLVSLAYLSSTSLIYQLACCLGYSGLKEAVTMPPSHQPTSHLHPQLNSILHWVLEVLLISGLRA